jgi:hypothetical protein
MGIIGEALLLLCLGLVLACTVTKWVLVRELNKLRLQLAGLVSERQIFAGKQQQEEMILGYIQVQERELTNDCNDLLRELTGVRERIKQLDEAEKRIADKKKDLPA